MEQKISSSHRRGDLSASDSESDPERGFSGDDDDDRNYKHRRREIRPQSSEFDDPQSVSSKPFNKQNKSFQNGNSFRGIGTRMNEEWKNNSFPPSETEILKHDRRHFDMPMFSRPQMDINQKYGFARGSGRGSRNANATGFSSMEFSQVASHGSVPSGLYPGRGISKFSGGHTAAWNPYCLLPGIPSGGLEAVHSLGINPSHMNPINSPSISGIIRQKCRDFEERGFCLRGDMCPMEHGVNKIVVDDVQSLSKFNLPVSIPGGNRLGIGGESGPILAGIASTSFSVNSTKIRRKMGKSKTERKGTNSDAVGVFPNSAAAGNDFYDPDQPLLNKNGSASSTALSQPCSPEIQQEEPILCRDSSCENPDYVRNSSGIYPLSGNALSGADTHSLMQSSLESLHGAASGSHPKGKVIPNRPGHNDYIQEKDETLNNNQMTSAQGIYVLSENKYTNSLDASQRRLKGSSHNSQKHQQKAMRTIFVNGIPQKDNNIQALRSHFQKFGEIIDIYIPANGERAFVQFSSREEAEAALKAPDAVMCNRFIKLWWANRDSIPDTGSSGGNNTYVNPLVDNVYSGPNSLSHSSKGRNNLLPASTVIATLADSSTPKVSAVSSAQINVSGQGKHSVSIGPVALAPSQKKLENLEGLKEEIRKKQELLEQKRNEFKRQLDKLEKQKQAAGVKCNSPSEQSAKRHKAEMTADVAKRTAPHSADTSTSITLTEAEEVTQKVKPVNKPLVQDPNTATEPTTSVNVINLPLAETVNVLMNRSKLDKAFYSSKSLNGHDLQFAWVSEDIGEHDKILSALEEPMDVDTASSNNVLEKENVSQPDVDLKAIAEDTIDKVEVPNEKLAPHKELVEDQHTVYGEEKACYSHPAEHDFIKHEKQSFEEGYAEKADDKKSHNQDSLKTLDNQDCEEEDDRAFDRPLSGDEIRRSFDEKQASQIDVDHMKDEHCIEEAKEKPRQNEDLLSDDDIM